MPPSVDSYPLSGVNSEVLPTRKKNGAKASDSKNSIFSPNILSRMKMGGKFVIFT